MPDNCKHCGACPNHVRCLCCGHCRSCGAFIAAPFSITWGGYYPPPPNWSGTITYPATSGYVGGIAGGTSQQVTASIYTPPEGTQVFDTGIHFTVTDLLSAAVASTIAGALKHDLGSLTAEIRSGQ